MATLLTASLVLFLPVYSFSVSAGQRIITAESGENVILTCRAAENKPVIVAEWTRTDLGSDEHVVLYKDNQFDPEGQSPSFKNRADLLDVKNGDVSLVLKNVKISDTGRYVCRVDQGGNNRRKRSLLGGDPISIIYLKVEPGQRIIRAEPGDNVILPCRADENSEVIIVEWRRTDLWSDQPVLLYKDKQFDPEGQSPSFKNRVDLLDVKNGDVSLVLKKVTTDDTGTYECQVVQGRNGFKFISTVDLRVDPGNEEKLKEDGGNWTGLIVGLGFLFLLLFMCIIGCRRICLQDLTQLQHQKLNWRKLQQYRKKINGQLEPTLKLVSLSV